MASILDLTDRQCVLDAIAEADRVGLDAFLSRHGYKGARSYWLEYKGKRYPSKAIAGVAYGLQHRGKKVAAADFSGGVSTVWRALTRLGFDVTAPTGTQPPTDREPTSDRDVLEQRTLAILAKTAGRPLAKPAGNPKPKRVIGSNAGFERDPSVRAFVLQRARGLCESGCGQKPFTTDDGRPYLEVHHVRPLADKGSDTVENAVALCASCHRAMHCAKDRDARRAALYKRVPALIKE